MEKLTANWDKNHQRMDNGHSRKIWRHID